MDRAEFTVLPVGVALGLLFDANPALAKAQAPELVKAPRYDGRIFKKGGFQWMSEMLAADLRWWRERKTESANGDGKYAESDRKSCAALDKWIAWREQSPNETWSGTRGDDNVTAAPPSKFPAIHENTGRRPPPPPADDMPPPDDDDSPIPF